MRKQRVVKKIAAMMAIIAVVSTATGCSTTFTSEDVRGYSLVNQLSRQEVIDYYAKALEYDSVVTKNITLHTTDYEKRAITAEKADELKKIVASAEEVLANEEYEADIVRETDDTNIILEPDKNNSVISKNLFDYIKSSIDGYKLSDGEVTDITGALGYYFVDVEYNVSAAETGTLKETSDMMGLDGVYKSTWDGGYEIDKSYLNTAKAILNNYFIENELFYAADYTEDGLITITVGSPSEADTTKKPSKYTNRGNSTSAAQNNAGNTGNESSENSDNSENENGANTAPNGANTAPNGGNDSAPDDNTSAKANDEEDVSDIVENTKPSADLADHGIPEVDNGKGDTIVSNSVTPDKRKVHLDIEFINRLVGASLNQSSFLPELSLVYEPKYSGGISGYGIYPEGSNGLRIFGYNRDELSGKLKIRYVLKDTVDGTGRIEVMQAYVNSIDINTGFDVSDQSVVIPEFLNTELEKVIERQDRVQANCDLAGMMNGDIYEDKGYAILRGYKNNCSNTLKYMSTIRQVLARDTANNAYLLDVETTIVDGDKTADKYATFRDRSYVVIQQLGDEFIITDSVRISRTTEVEPEIDPDSAVAKRIVALNLSGVVSDEAKTGIKGLLSNLYTADTNRVLNGPKEITVNGNEKLTIEKGMYDCFNSDVTMLSTEDREYMNSTLRNVLIKYGASVKSVHTGTVTEWIGGYTNQAEFTTEELVSYNGIQDGWYMRVYYLVSKMEDEWVIDERTVIDEYKVTGDEMSSIKERVGQ